MESDNNSLIKNDNRQECIRKLGDKNKQFENVSTDQTNINAISLSNNPNNSLTKRNIYNKQSKEQIKDANKDTSKERENSIAQWLVNYRLQTYLRKAILL